MKGKGSFLRSTVVTAGMFLLAAALLLGGGVRGARAALSVFSDNFITRMQLQDIGVSILENGERISWRDYVTGSDGQWDTGVSALLSGALQEGEEWQPGRTYPEELRVKNSGSIDTFVRVSIYKYWTDADGVKRTDLDPSLIELGIPEDSGWTVDTAASTPERTVLYYSAVLPAVSDGEAMAADDARRVTTPFLQSVTVNADIARHVTQTTAEETDADGNLWRTVTTVYDYDGAMFHIRVSADAVQTHNAQDAIGSAWGVSAALVGQG